MLSVDRTCALVKDVLNKHGRNDFAYSMFILICLTSYRNEK